MRSFWRAMIAAVAALVLVGLGSALSRQLTGGWLSLSLATPIVVWLAVDAGLVEGAAASVIVGLVLDGASGGPAGLLTFLSLVLFLSCRAAAAAPGAHSNLGMTTLAALGGLLVGLLAILLQRYVATAAAAPRWTLVGRVAVDASVSALFTPPVRWVLDRAMAVIGVDEVGDLG